MQPRFLIIQTYYPEFLAPLYDQLPEIKDWDYEDHLRYLFDTGFFLGDAYSDGLRRLGCETAEVICNADILQARWVAEHGVTRGGQQCLGDAPLSANIHDRRRQIVEAQIKAFRPDVLFVFEWCPLGDEFLAMVKPEVQLIIGQIASPIRPERNYASYDLMLSSVPQLVDYFRSEGMASELLRLGFDERVPNRLGDIQPKYDVTFVGGVAPSHPDRIEWLEELVSELHVDIFGYGWDRMTADSPLRHCVHGPVWGREMYRTLRASRVTLNRHARIDVGSPTDGDFANNMRLFEATGVGTCLVTEAKSNLAQMFEPDCEVVTYKNSQECIEKVRYLLRNNRERDIIASSGQRRTLAEHTYRQRMAELVDIVRRQFRSSTRAGHTQQRPPSAEVNLIKNA